ncbi:unnamed protein product [Bathycoccus prasinos]
MDVYVLHDSTLPRDRVIIFRHDKSGEYNNVSSPEIDGLRKKIQHCKEEIIKRQEQIYPRGTEDELSPEEKYDRIHPKGYYKNEAATRRPAKEEHDINTTEFSVWDKPDTRTPFQKGDEPVLSDLQKAGIYWKLNVIVSVVFLNVALGKNYSQFQKFMGITAPTESFLDKRLATEAVEHRDFTIEFKTEDYYFKLPKHTPESAVANVTTYEAPLIVPAIIRFPLLRLSAYVPVKFCNLPLMTTSGNFIINGSPRVVVHQMAIGFSYADVIDAVYDPLLLMDTRDAVGWVQSRNEALIVMMSLLFPTRPATVKAGRTGHSKEKLRQKSNDIAVNSRHARWTSFVQGKNAGLVGSLASFAQINADGFVMAPYYKMQKEQTRPNTQGFFLLTACYEDQAVLASGDVNLAKPRVSTRLRRAFTEHAPKKIDYLGLCPIQFMSIATALIPFLEHDDANRALMGSNMQRQAVSLLRSERAFVGTGLEGRITRDSGSLLVAKQTGYVTYADAQRIEYVTPKDDPTGTQFKLIAHSVELESYHRSNQDSCLHHRPLVEANTWVQKGDCLADNTATFGGELALGRNIFVGYMPWEGYNFEDAVLVSERLVFDDLFTSIHIERYDVETVRLQDGQEYFTPAVANSEYLDELGIVKVGTWVESGDILVGKISPQKDSETTPEQKLLRAIFGGEVFIYLVQKRRLQIGDKVAGRHGNKGIVSNILPRADMPFVQNGQPLDMVLNPLGVPSRMNVGQIFECLLGLAAHTLEKNFKVVPFDEMHGDEISRGFVYQYLYEARLMTQQKWLFRPSAPGKTIVFDGRTGSPFEQPVTVGYPYILKLVHLVDDKIHARSTGPYSLVTQQPLGGRSKHGGQRLGEMEVWALEGFGAAYTLQELLTIKSDDMNGRTDAFMAMIRGTLLPKPGIPESFKVLVSELRGLWENIGEILKADTINYLDTSPEDDPTAIQEVSVPKSVVEICPYCQVEPTDVKVRRYRMGRITLRKPVAHMWYFKNTPNVLANLLPIKARKITEVIYFSEYSASLPNAINYCVHPHSIWAVNQWKQLSPFFAGTPQRLLDKPAPWNKDQIIRRAGLQSIENCGAQAIETFLHNIDLEFLERVLTAKFKYELQKQDARSVQNEIDSQIAAAAALAVPAGVALEQKQPTRHPVATKFRQTAEDIAKHSYFTKFDSNTEMTFWQEDVTKMLNRRVDVTKYDLLPPDLRPMIQMSSGRFAAADMNDLYRRLIYRKIRFDKFISLFDPEYLPDLLIRHDLVLLQEAVDAIIDNGRLAKPMMRANRTLFKSLTAVIEGKQGRFRQNLLGKRVDYSGRSVIVVGPKLRLHQCGLPREMALELFQPFVIRALLAHADVTNIRAAKNLIQRRTSLVWETLETVVHGHPILLNRAPTLHRLGIQAFEPILLPGRAIQLHPLVCPAFNADFDGDQMAVHIPLSLEAQAEARLLMLATHNWLSPATGEPSILPSQDMILGFYYLTAAKPTEKMTKRRALRQQLFHLEKFRCMTGFGYVGMLVFIQIAPSHSKCFCPVLARCVQSIKTILWNIQRLKLEQATQRIL